MVRYVRSKRGRDGRENVVHAPATESGRAGRGYPHRQAGLPGGRDRILPGAVPVAQGGERQPVSGELLGLCKGIDH